jgi:site-specific recombinase XerD
VDLYDAASFHALTLGALGRSPRTISQYLHYERKFLAYLEAKKLPRTLDALSSINVRQAILWLQADGRGSRGGQVGIAYFLETMKLWAKFLEREGVYQISPLARMGTMKVDEVEPVPFTQTEVAALLAACDMRAKGERPWPARDRAVFYLLLDTGMRAGELASLVLDRVLLGERRVAVQGKSRRGRSVPFGDATRQDGGPGVRAVRVYLREREDMRRRWPERAGDELILTWQGRPMGVQGIEGLVRRWGERAGVHHAHPHRFRHGYASWYLTVHVGDETGLQAILGHVDPSMMRRYVHLARVSVERRAAQAMPSRFLKSS